MLRGKGHLLIVAALAGFFWAQYQINGLILISALLFLSYLYQNKRLRLLELLSIVVVIFFFKYHYAGHFNQTYMQQSEDRLLGQVLSINNEQGSFRSFIIKAEQGNKVLIVDFSNSNATVVVAGATCMITGEIEVINQATNPGQFDYQRYLRNQGVLYQVVVNNSEDLVCQGINWLGQLSLLKGQLLNYLERYYDQDALKWMYALVFGDRSLIDAPTIDLFTKWHLSHLLAISGLHINIMIAIFSLILLKFFRVTKETTVWFNIILLIFMPFFAGGTPSVWRAAIVAWLSLMALQFKQYFLSLDILSIAFVLLLLLKPVFIFQLGFQFSFLISFFIITSKKILSDLPKHVKPIFITSLSMFVALPIQIQTFYIFNPFSIFLNLFFSFIFSLILVPLSVTAVIIAFLFPYLTGLLNSLISIVDQAILQIIDFFNKYLYMPIIFGRQPDFFILFYFLLIYLLLLCFERKQVKKTVSIFIALLCLLFVMNIRPYLNPLGKVTMLDVEQADTIIIELPYRKGVILYDVGGSYSGDFTTPSPRLYEQRIRPFLYYYGIDKIDTVILSHEDHDHIGSLAPLVADFSIGLIITSPYFNTDIIQSIDAPHKSVNYGESFMIRGQRFTVISPFKDWGNANDNSLVLQTNFADQAWLLTGDISKDVELNIINNFPQLAVTTLSIAHHGSASSSHFDFLNQLEPDFALISVGKNNHYQHPHQAVIDQLREMGITILRTDKNGAVQFFFSNQSKKGTFYPFIP
ncbi:competence protein ComEC [Amphibacillus marinus]|uniref:Competence protein ComEC n=1 Tax=Amphibacillus marinus TaxID=872970 RepID=A0A1H8NSW3_9BACI|nr:DNA internalization-related competence protein ComEC/Rec2 [Amphibacillus marinus]SEO32717.1 competence protein ComEC [Amphibacillus marinus]